VGRRAIAITAVLALVLGATATAAIAGCPRETKILCTGFTYRAHGHTYHVTHVGLAENGPVHCATARTHRGLASATISAAARSQQRRRLAASIRPALRFTAGLCGSLRFALHGSPAVSIAPNFPTTVDFNAVGPEARQTSFGVAAPTSFSYGPIPISYDVTATEVHWLHWGALTAEGHGSVTFCVIMSPCSQGPFTVVLSNRRLARCGNGLTHFGYAEVRLDLSELPEPPSPEVFSDTILVGCTGR
jgi:hypothetical protein